MVMPRVLALAFAPSATETKNGLSRVLITSVADLPPPADVSAGLVRLQAARDRVMVVTTAKVTRVFLRMVHAFLQGGRDLSRKSVWDREVLGDCGVMEWE